MKGCELSCSFAESTSGTQGAASELAQHEREARTALSAAEKQCTALQEEINSLSHKSVGTEQLLHTAKKDLENLQQVIC